MNFDWYISMEFKMMKQIYTIMIMNKIIYCTLYKQTENLCQFCSSTVLRRPTSFCYRNQLAATLAMCIAASRRNGSRRYPILLCHLMTQNQKFWCSPETFRLSFHGIQGVPKKNWAQLEPRFWKSVVETKIFPLVPWRMGMSKAQILFGTPWIP